VPSIDYDDIKQIIMTHIYRKWHLWDQKKPIEPWLSRVVSNQFKNLLRNYYGNYANPCPDHGLHYHDQCNCEICKKWRQSKKSAYDVKLAVTIESHYDEVCEKKDKYVDLETATKKLTLKLKPNLSEKQFTAFEMLFVKNCSDEDVAKFLGNKTNEKKRTAGYKQIKNLRKLFQEKARQILENEDII
jgi:DNA-directed RNA polymerase specialized sigma24 family protein